MNFKTKIHENLCYEHNKPFQYPRQKQKPAAVNSVTSRYIPLESSCNYCKYLVIWGKEFELFSLLMVEFGTIKTMTTTSSIVSRTKF